MLRIASFLDDIEDTRAHKQDYQQSRPSWGRETNQNALNFHPWDAWNNYWYTDSLLCIIQCTQILGTNCRMRSRCVPGPFSGLGTRLDSANTSWETSALTTSLINHICPPLKVLRPSLKYKMQCDCIQSDYCSLPIPKWQLESARVAYTCTCIWVEASYCLYAWLYKLTMANNVRVIDCSQTVISLISDVPPWLCIVEVGESVSLPLASLCWPPVTAAVDPAFWLAPCTCKCMLWLSHIECRHHSGSFYAM